MFLLGKVENDKYPEAETWHPESTDERSYYRLCENFRWPFGTADGGNLDPILVPSFFLIDFTRILWFFWDLRIMLFDIHKNVVFPELLVFSNIFGFSAGSFHTKQWKIFEAWTWSLSEFDKICQVVKIYKIRQSYKLQHNILYG